MTNVLFRKDNGLYTGFHLSGHACFNTTGPDILCSAISMGAQMTELGLREVAKINVNETVGDGCYEVAMLEGYESEVAQSLVHTLHLSLENLRSQYPDFITISQVGE